MNGDRNPLHTNSQAAGRFTCGREDPTSTSRAGRIIFEDTAERPETDVNTDARGDVTE